MVDLDLDYAPRTYWPGEWTTDLVTTKGSFDRWIGQGMAPQSAPQFGASPASLEAGEYLPDFEPGEVEIARIELASVLGDVYSVRARVLDDGLIHYRVVDEYENEFEADPESSPAPISLRTLIHLIDSVERDDDMYGHGLTNAFRDMNLECGGEPSDYLNFVEVSSLFYGDLGTYYRLDAQQWLESRRRSSAEAD